MSDDTENDDKDRLISLQQAAEIYGFNADYLSSRARKGRIKAIKTGRGKGMWITTRADVEVFIASRKKTGVYRDDIVID